jgi:hypothetical protein
MKSHLEIVCDYQQEEPTKSVKGKENSKSNSSIVITKQTEALNLENCINDRDHVIQSNEQQIQELKQQNDKYLQEIKNKDAKYEELDSLYS